MEMFNNIDNRFLQSNNVVQNLELNLENVEACRPQELDFVKVSNYYQLIDYLSILFKELNIKADVYEEENESFESTPIIVHRLVSKQPGASTSASYKDVESNNDSYHSYMMPIRRGAYINAEEPGTLTVYYVFPRDYIIELIPYSTSTRESNEIAFQIEEAITCYRDLIRRQGISDIIYIETGTKVIKNIGSTKFVGTPVKLFARLLQYYEVKEERLLNIYTTCSLESQNCYKTESLNKKIIT